MKAKKKINPMTPQKLRCPYCGAAAQIKPASEIYHDSSQKGEMYVCGNYPRCNAYVGTHLNTRIPLGPLANGDLRHMRIKAHRKFDHIWKSGIMSRENAYRWMADYFGLRLEDAHIGMFSEYRCNELIKKCDSVLAQCEKTAC